MSKNRKDVSKSWQESIGIKLLSTIMPGFASRLLCLPLLCRANRETKKNHPDAICSKYHFIMILADALNLIIIT